MATLTVQRTSRTPGLNVISAASAADGAGDKWANTGAEVVLVTNGGTGSIVLTQHFGVQATIDGVAPANRDITIAAAGSFLFGPFPPQTWNDANGFMNLSYDVVTSVTVLVLANGT